MNSDSQSPSIPSAPDEVGAVLAGASIFRPDPILLAIGDAESASGFREAVESAWESVGNPGAGGRFGPWWIPAPLRAHLQEFASAIHGKLACQAIEIALARPVSSSLQWSRFQLVAGSYRSRTGARLLTEPLSHTSDSMSPLRDWALGGEPAMRSFRRLEAFLAAKEPAADEAWTVIQRARAGLVAAAAGIAEGERPGPLLLLWELYKAHHEDELRHLGALRAKGVPVREVREALCWLIGANGGEILLASEPHLPELRERATDLAATAEMPAVLTPGSLRDAENLWWHLTASAVPIYTMLVSTGGELPYRLFRYLFEAPLGIHAPWVGITPATYLLRPWTEDTYGAFDEKIVADERRGPYAIRPDDDVLKAYRAALPALSEREEESHPAITNALEIPFQVERGDGRVVRGYLRVLNTYRTNSPRIMFEAPASREASWLAQALQGMLANRLPQRLPGGGREKPHGPEIRVAPTVQPERGLLVLPDGRVSDFVGVSPAVLKIREQLMRYASGAAAVLITGESGTGKELLAADVHSASARYARPFHVLEVASFQQKDVLRSTLFGVGAAFGAVGTAGQEPLLVAYDGGTLVLDEFARMSVENQYTLLRVLGSATQEFARSGDSRIYRTSVRFVCTTNRDIPAHMEAGLFLSDLYYRVAHQRIHVPPIRDRREDIPEIARILLRRILVEHGYNEFRKVLDDTALEHLESVPFTWPGNARNLETVLRNALGCPDHVLTAAFLSEVTGEMEPLLNGKPDLGKPRGTGGERGPGVMDFA